MPGSTKATRNCLIVLLIMNQLMAVTDGMPNEKSATSRGIAAQTVTTVAPVFDGPVADLLEHEQPPNQIQSLISGRDSTGCSWPTAANVDLSPLFWNFVNVSCRPGFQYESGPPHWTIVQCVNNKGLSPVPKSCIRVSCPPLTSFTDASLNTTRTSYGTRVNVSCAVGKQLMRSTSNWIVTECQADGTWSAKPSKCLSAAPGTPTVAHSLYGRNGVLAMDLSNDELFVIRVNENYVSVYDSFSLELKRQIVIPGISETYGLAVSSVDSLLYVGDYTNHRVHRVDLSTNIVTGWFVSYAPFGLSVASNGNVLVATQVNNKILEYTSNGTHVRDITDGYFLYQAVERISDGTLVIIRSGSIYGIALMTRDGGRVIRSFGDSLGSGPARMSAPRALVVDSEGSILVADYLNNRIQLVNPSLSTARTLPLPHSITLSNPHALCYDESRGRLFVGENGGQFRVLVFDNVTNIY